MEMPQSLLLTVARNLRCNLFIFGGLAALSGLSSQVQAQIATIGVAERIVEKRTGQTGSWQNTKKGAVLTHGDGLRTGKRSKVDTLFRDGSLVRLGQISTLEIQSGTAGATRVKLQDGRVIFVKKPGSGGTSRVLTGTGAAEIKGSVALVEQNDDGSAEYTNFAGSVSVVGLNNDVETQRIDLPPGYWVKSFPGGALSPIKQAALFSSQREMINEPVQSPFAGSLYHELARIEPGVLHIDTSLNNTNIGNTSSNPFIPRSPLPGGQPPFGGPFPPPPGTGSGTGTGAGTGGLLAARQPPEQLNTTRTLLNSSSATVNAPPTKNDGAKPVSQPILIAQVNPPSPVLDSGQAAQAVGQNTGAGQLPEISKVDFGPTYKHLENVNRRLGKISGIDYRATGLIGSDSLRGAFGHLHGFMKEGALSADLIVNPQDFRFDAPARRISRDNSVISHATLAYETKAVDLIVGRQRFVSGPVRASYFGSMTRSGSREIMDAVRFVPNLGKNFGAEISYLYDAFPRDLPYNVRNNQQGFLGRIHTRQSFGNFGLNVLKYKDSPVPDRTGITLDFSLPVLTNKLDFYGEVGSDPFRRNLQTFGITIPYLYQKTNFDLYIERARLKGSAAAAGIGSEWTVRLYRRINENMDFVGAYNRFSGGNSTFVVGVSLGGQTIIRPK